MTQDALLFQFVRLPEYFSVLKTLKYRNQICRLSHDLYTAPSRAEIVELAYCLLCCRNALYNGRAACCASPCAAGWRAVASRVFVTRSSSRIVFRERFPAMLWVRLGSSRRDPRSSPRPLCPKRVLRRATHVGYLCLRVGWRRPRQPRENKRRRSARSSCRSE